MIGHLNRINLKVYLLNNRKNKCNTFRNNNESRRTHPCTDDLLTARRTLPTVRVINTSNINHWMHN